MEGGGRENGSGSVFGGLTRDGGKMSDKSRVLLVKCKSVLVWS